MQRKKSWNQVFAVLAILFTVSLLTGCGAAEPVGDQAMEAEAASPAAAAPDAKAGGDEVLDESSGGSLAGTSWRLVEFQSMSDEVGTIRPQDPDLYTMTLHADGTVAVRLNCNRGTGSWSAEPGADGDSGGFEFGPLATTRALCPPPSMDERIAADAQWVRGFLLKDGNLYLSLMADGGIYAWEPISGSAGAEVPFETQPDPEIEEAIRQASPDYTAEIVEIDGNPARYLYSRFDLNGDGRKEVFAYPLGSIFCGSGGCNLLMFIEEDGGYALVNNFPISRLPVIVSEQATEGWRDLIRPESGGGAAPSYVRHAFDGEKYVERERLPAEPEPEGTRVLTGEFTFQDGIPLEPSE